MHQATVEDLTAYAFRDPLSFIELCVAAGGTVREKAIAWLRDALARFEGEKSFYEVCLPQLAKRIKRTRRLDDHDCFYDAWLYCFTQLKAGSHANLWLPLNRHYKPLGKPYGEAFNYEDFAAQAWQFPFDPRNIADVWRLTGYQPYLYRAGKTPCSVKEFEDYLARLGKLLAATGNRAPGYLACLLRSLPA
jgi:hypothetical protein